jgi:hypothetical protein
LLKDEPGVALTHLDRAAKLIAGAPRAKPTDIAEVRMLAGSNALLFGKAHATLGMRASAARAREHQEQAATLLRRSISELEHLTNDPVIGKDVVMLTKEARRLLQTSS